MSKFNSDIVINKQLIHVFEFIIDVNNNPKWQEVNRVENIKYAKSNKLKSFSEFQSYRGKEAESKSKVVLWKQNKMFGYRSRLGNYDLKIVYRFTEVAEGTKISAEGDLRGGGYFGSSVWFLLVSPKVLQKQLLSNLNKLKSLMEAAHA